MKFFYISIICLIFSTQILAQSPVRIAIAGLSHGHVDWIFNREEKNDILLVGIYETNNALVEKYIARYKLDRNLFFTEMDEMLEQVKPNAVSAFGAINEHVKIVRACAPRGIHVMVEKPLATNLAEAKEIETLAKENSIYVLTNFETSWYSSNQYVDKLVESGKLGKIRKVMVNDGHEGPKEIGVSKEFLGILTDPTKNGAGALVDFGCYGANLMTWLKKGERPISVTAVINQNKPEIYKEVDDEATIILQYPKAQCVIQASWNWPFPRKDMEVYGNKGYAIAEDATTVYQRLPGESEKKTIRLDPRSEPFDDPFSFLASVVNGTITMDENSQYGLPINVIVVEILEAAKLSAANDKTIYLN